MKSFIILFNPLNTLFSYNFQYQSRINHIKIFNENKEKLKEKLIFLPFIEKDVFNKYKEIGILDKIYYLCENEEEKNIIKKEHKILNLNQFYECKFILKNNINNYFDYNIIIITEELNDFNLFSNNNNNNVCKIFNWMIFNEDENYLNFQKNVIKSINFNNINLIIECLRQSSFLIEYLFINKEKNNIVNLINNYFKDCFNCLYVLDSKSNEKSYRKRELAQSSKKVKYFPFLNKNIPIKNLNFYPFKIHVFLQRCPYFYLKNTDYYKENIQKLIDSDKNIVQLHNIEIIDILFNRFKVIEYIKKFIENSKEEIKNNNLNINLNVPITKEFEYDFNDMNKNINNIKNIIKENNINFPFILKPNSCERHEMKLIISEEGLINIFNNKNDNFFNNNKNNLYVIQERIKHGGIMIKNYNINEESFSFIRPSLPDNAINNKNFNNNFIDFYNEMIYKKNDILFENYEEEKVDNLKKKLLEKIEIINKLSNIFIKITKLTLFGLDFLYDEENDKFYILEINYFPSYRELGKELHNKFDEHIIKFYNKFKK